MNLAAAERTADQDLDQRVYLRGVTWDQYEALLAMRGESAVPRITYLRGVVELMSPSRPHERIKMMIARLVEAYANDLDLDLNGYGSWTLKSEPDDRGAEADECYVLGTAQVSPEEKERPDLAIEVVWTSGGIDKLEVYRGLLVGEVWSWKKGTISVFVLGPDGYREVERSVLLPALDLTLIARLAVIPSQREAVQALRAALRDSS